VDASPTEAIEQILDTVAHTEFIFLPRSPKFFAVFTFSSLPAVRKETDNGRSNLTG
jgi:hypothetical protein